MRRVVPHALLAFLGAAAPWNLSAQSCRQSILVDPARFITVSAWDGSETTFLQSCGEAETLRGQLFLKQLAYLSGAQTASANKVNADIKTALAQMGAARKELAAVRNQQQAQVASTTIQSMKWLVSKTKLLLCAGAAADSGGMALVACAGPLLSFLKKSQGTFQSFSMVAEARDREKQLVKIIDEMSAEFDRMSLTAINGSGTAQRFQTAFQSMCDQIRKSCQP